MLALHLELPLRWPSDIRLSLEHFEVVCFKCVLHAEALFLYHVWYCFTVSWGYSWWFSFLFEILGVVAQKKCSVVELFSFIAGFQDPQLPTQLNHQQVPSNMNGNMPTTWLSDLMFSFASLVGCSWLDALSQHQSRTLGVWLVHPVMSTATYWNDKALLTHFDMLFLVPLIGGRWYIITQLAIYTTSIPLIYCQLGDYMLPIPPIKGTRKLHAAWSTGNSPWNLQWTKSRTKRSRAWIPPWN